MLQLGELPDDTSGNVAEDAKEKQRKQFASAGLQDRLRVAVGCGLERNPALVLSRPRTLFRVPRLRIRRIDVDDKPLAPFGVGYDFAQSLRQLVKWIIEEVETEDVGIEEVGPVTGTFAHHIDILLVERGCPDAILVREAGE